MNIEIFYTAVMTPDDTLILSSIKAIISLMPSGGISLKVGHCPGVENNSMNLRIIK